VIAIELGFLMRDRSSEEFLRLSIHLKMRPTMEKKIRTGTVPRLVNGKIRTTAVTQLAKYQLCKNSAFAQPNLEVLLPL
jgi:hypothetical protein